MPNWCENNLSIHGPKDEMDRFHEIIKKDDGEYSLLENLYPTPEDLINTTSSYSKDDWSDEQKANFEKYGHADWYSWRIANWGTKWKESDLYVGQEYTVNEVDGTATIAFNFNTAWAPPIEAFDKISKDWPNLLFCIYYEEPGMAFCGNCIWLNGEQKEASHSDMVNRFFDEEYLYEMYNDNK